MHTRHGHGPHDMVTFHTAWPCRVEHYTRSTRHGQFVPTAFHTTWSGITRHGRVPHDMPTRHGGCRVEIWLCRVYTMSCGTSDHVVWCFGFTDVKENWVCHPDICTLISCIFLLILKLNYCISLSGDQLDSLGNWKLLIVECMPQKTLIFVHWSQVYFY